MMIYLLILIFYVYLILRNNKVLALRDKITNGCYNYMSYYLSQFKDDKDFIEHIDEYNKEIFSYLNFINMSCDIYQLNPSSNTTMAIRTTANASIILNDTNPNKNSIEQVKIH